jgi:ABC-type phosphonate transport system ATPase subunit
MKDVPPIITIRGLCNSFGDQVIHKDLDLDVRPGEILGVVGGSGDLGHADTRDQGQRRREREEGTADDDTGPKAGPVRRRQA